MLLFVVLAGCTRDAPPVEEECEDAALCDLEEFLGEHHCVKNDLPRTYAPDVPDRQGRTDPWVLGDWWQYRLEATGQEPSTTKLVYYDIQDNGAHYMVGTPTREEALEHAVFSTNPVIGRVHKTLYSPHESGSHADMFNFPLCAGNTWSDRYYATDFDFRVSQATLQIPGGSDAGYRIDGTSDDGSTVTIQYSPKVKWFTRIDLDRADGLRVDMTLTDYGTGASGPAYFLRGQQDATFELQSDAGNVIQPLDLEAGSGGDYDTLGFQMQLERTAGTGRVEVHLRDPSGEGVYCVGVAGDGINGATECEEPGTLVEVPWQEGRWELVLDMPIGLGNEATANVALASIYDRSGSV